jgi:hypothetical protein
LPKTLKVDETVRLGSGTLAAIDGLAAHGAA